MAVPRVLLVEDDASIRRFFALALEDLPLQVVACAGLQEGLQALAQARFDLIVTDLMLPDGNGSELLERLAQTPGAPRRIVFSAGVTAARRAQFEALGVWRILDKPASMAALIDGVGAALGLATDAPSAAPAPAPDDPVQRHFGGDATLFAAFRDSALRQFGADIAEGDRAAAGADLPALRRLVHSLKSVLGLLGDDEGADLARTLERQAAAGEARACSGWPRLRARLAARAGP